MRVSWLFLSNLNIFISNRHFWWLITAILNFPRLCRLHQLVHSCFLLLHWRFQYFFWRFLFFIPNLLNLWYGNRLVLFAMFCGLYLRLGELFLVVFQLQLSLLVPNFDLFASIQSTFFKWFSRWSEKVFHCIVANIRSFGMNWL